MVYSIQWDISQSKRNEIPVHATTWMKLENIILSERNQA